MFVFAFVNTLFCRLPSGPHSVLDARKTSGTYGGTLGSRATNLIPRLSVRTPTGKLGLGSNPSKCNKTMQEEVRIYTNG